MNDLISRQAAIDAVDEGLTGIFVEHRAIAEKMIGKLTSAQPDLDSAYTEGYTQAEAKYRALWDEMPEIIRCKDCKHRDPEDKKCDCGHDILWQLPRDDNWFCADAERREE